MNRERQLAEAFVGLADTQADDFDPVTLLDRLAGHGVDIMGADAAGILVVTARGELRTLAVSADDAALFELFQAQAQTRQGPGLDCYRLRRPVDAPDLTESAERWPQLAPLAVRAGYRAAHALPLRVNQQLIGVVNLLLAAPGGLSPTDLELGQALADVAAVALVHWSPAPARPADVLIRVQAAVAAKAAVEMATGMLTEHGRIAPAQAARALRFYSARNGDRLTETARALLRRSLHPDTVLTAPHP